MVANTRARAAAEKTCGPTVSTSNSPEQVSNNGTTSLPNGSVQTTSRRDDRTRSGSAVARPSRTGKGRALEEADDSASRKRPRKGGVTKAAGMAPFGYDLPYDRLDLRAHPHLYRPGKAGSEQGVFHCQPYKDELLPHWAFKNPATATKSSSALESAFRRYVDQGDFVGADCARKFIQMGFTRARRYANHAGGRKYASSKGDSTHEGRKTVLLRSEEDPVKAESASIFMTVLKRVKADESYLRLQHEFQEKYRGVPLPDLEEVEQWTRRTSSEL